MLVCAAVALLLPCGARGQTVTLPVPGPGDAAGERDLLAPSIEPPAAPPGAWARTQIAAARVDAPPRIDGRINDACWRQATHARGFWRLGTGAAVTQQTEAWIATDKTHLYVAFHCLDSEPGQIRASETQRGGNVYGDDFVAVHLDSQNTRRGFSTFAVSARGTQRESLEGGTADNITWAGDWKAATLRTEGGWSAEIAIPFALLRYPRGARSFHIALRRKMARETSSSVWPYLPANGEDNLPEYLAELTGIAPPFFAPRPTFLPYVLATGGDNNRARQGLDIKYPISTTLTGVATLFPDFQTIEQDVTSINFSYTEQFVGDRRPFFAEGANFLPGRDLFYSRRIEDVDAGLKVVGKSGATTLGLLGTTAQSRQDQGAYVFHLNRDFGLYSQAGVELVGGSRPGRPSNQVARVYGGFGWQSAATRYQLFGNITPSWQNGAARGGSSFLRFGGDPTRGHPWWGVYYRSIAPDFISDLGFVPETDLRGYGFNTGQFNQFDRGPVEFYSVSVGASRFTHFGGDFFRDGVFLSLFAQARSGWGMNLSADNSHREQFHDQVQSAGLSWGNKTLFQRGGVNQSWGRQAGEAYRFQTLRQSFLIARPLSVQVDWSHLQLGGETSQQTIVTGSYRLSATQTIGGRLLQRAGSNAGNDKGTNLYFAFAQKVRAGADLFLLFGDPNSPRTRGQVTLKLVNPL